MVWLLSQMLSWVWVGSRLDDGWLEPRVSSMHMVRRCFLDYAWLLVVWKKQDPDQVVGAVCRQGKHDVLGGMHERPLFRPKLDKTRLAEPGPRSTMRLHEMYPLALLATRAKTHPPVQLEVRLQACRSAWRTLHFATDEEDLDVATRRGGTRVPPVVVRGIPPAAAAGGPCSHPVSGR